jgi:putative pre-16S rRNA nuclease
MDEEKFIHIMAFDFGTKRIGVAIGQTITKTAQALKSIRVQHGVPDWQTLDHLIKQWQPDAMVIGIPLNMDGSEQALSKKARDFAKRLGKRYGLPCFAADERLTTRDAKERLFESGGYKALQDGQVDQLAAQLILENWFQTQG